jgi:hypothetical protein
MGSRRRHGRALRMHTIAGANTLIPQEVDAVAARIYRDQIDPNAPAPSPIEPFGVGAAHALGARPGTFAGQFSFEELRAAGMPEDMLTLVRRGLVDATELAVLARTESSEQARKIAEQTREYCRLLVAIRPSVRGQMRAK